MRGDNETIEECDEDVDCSAFVHNDHGSAGSTAAAAEDMATHRNSPSTYFFVINSDLIRADQILSEEM